MHGGAGGAEHVLLQERAVGFEIFFAPAGEGGRGGCSGG